jgi:hypothetical protein
MTVGRSPCLASSSIVAVVPVAMLVEVVLMAVSLTLFFSRRRNWWVCFICAGLTSVLLGVLVVACFVV